MMELSEQEVIRRQSLDALRQMGIDPYPAAEYPTNAFSTDIKAEFKDEESGRPVCIAGRIMSRRIMGKASFIELQDSKGRIQVYVSRDDINTEAQPEMYNTVFKKLLDIGDFVGIRGFVFRTQMGEISVHAAELKTAMPFRLRNTSPMAIRLPMPGKIRIIPSTLCRRNFRPMEPVILMRYRSRSNIKLPTPWT